MGDKVGDKMDTDSIDIFQAKVLAEIRNNSNITKPQLMIKCGIDRTSIDNIIKTLKDRDYIR